VKINIKLGTKPGKSSQKTGVLVTSAWRKASIKLIINQKQLGANYLSLPL